MNKIILGAPKIALLFFFCFFAFSAPAFSEEPGPPPSAETEQKERTLFADTAYSLLDIYLSNMLLNIGARLNRDAWANVTFESIAHNIYPGTWFWEEGDRFLINQFGHPYQGSTYFTSARVNGFGFYESMPFTLAGSLFWEIACEPESGINDVITTVIGGIPVGEMLHRLFLEIDSNPSIGAKIGGFLVSPVEGFNAVYNRPKALAPAGSRIYGLSFQAGFNKSFAAFPGHQSEAASWGNPGAHIGVDVVYGNPFTQEGWKPYDHFELKADFNSNIDSYSMRVISDGYMFSFAYDNVTEDFPQKQKAYTSTGLTMEYDFFNTTNDLVNNTGYGNIQFSSNAFDWAVKHASVFPGQFAIEAKAHLGITCWATSMYNGSVINSDYWVPLGDTHGSYGFGGNAKFFLAFSHPKAGKLELSALNYYMFSIPVTPVHSAGNVFFLNYQLSYNFPLTKRIGIGADAVYWNLSGLYDSSIKVGRSLLTTGMYITLNF